MVTHFARKSLDDDAFKSLQQTPHSPTVALDKNLIPTKKTTIQVDKLPVVFGKNLSMELII